MPLTVVALAYRTSTAATTICCLEAAGFDVFCPGFQIANTLPHYALAIGGIALSVPYNQGLDALAFLNEVSHPEVPKSSVLSTGANGLGWLGFGVSSPWPDLLLMDAPTGST